jgi:hypothetical protein
MLELAEKCRKGLGHIDPYFDKLADGMLNWVACWQMLNPKVGGRRLRGGVCGVACLGEGDLGLLMCV